MSRPEHLAPPEIFYNDIEAKKYHQNTRIREIQTVMSERAIELLCLPPKYLENKDNDDSDDDSSSSSSSDDDNDQIVEDGDGDAQAASSHSSNTKKRAKKRVSFAKSHARGGRRLNPEFVPQMVLDVGCGSGISGDVLSEMGHHWIGVDISEHMLNVASERHVDGDMFLHDMGQGLSFRIGVFDAVISISALQWLCNADRKDHVPQKRLSAFFSTLYRCVKKGGRCVFQFYPENAKQLELISSSAMKSGFSGGVVVDYPNSTRAKKYFLCLFAGVPESQISMPRAMSDEDAQTVQYTGAKQRRNYDDKKGGKRSSLKGSREWIIRKKERDLRRGKEVRSTTKNTGRKRKTKF